MAEECGQCVRIAVIPRFHEHDDDILWPIDGRFTHGLLGSTGEPAPQKQDSVLAVAGVRPCEEKCPFPRAAGERDRCREF